jgi:ankyrin repeat protein
MVWTLLHALCAEQYHTTKHLEDILQRLQDHPEEARQENEDSTLPLHHLLKNDPPVHVVSKLVEAYPEAVFEENDMGYMPLHVACRYGCNVEAVTYLICRNPQAVERRARGSFDIMNLAQHFRYGLDVVTCEDMIKALPEDHPNRAALLDLIQRHNQ